MTEERTIKFAHRLQAGDTPTEEEFDALIFEANAHRPSIPAHTYLGLTPSELALFLEYPYNKAVAVLKEHRQYS